MLKGLEVSKVKIYQKRESLQKELNFGSEECMEENVVFKIILPRKFSLINMDINSHWLKY